MRIVIATVCMLASVGFCLLSLLSPRMFSAVGINSSYFFFFAIIAGIVGALSWVSHHRHQRQQLEEWRHQEQLAAMRRPAAPRPDMNEAIEEMRALNELYDKAAGLYRAGEKDRAIGILETLAAQGHIRATETLAKIRAKDG